MAMQGYAGLRRALKGNIWLCRAVKALYDYVGLFRTMNLGCIINIGFR